MTPGTIPHSGPSTGASKKQRAKGSGDPYLDLCEELHNLLTRKRGYYGCADESPLQNAMGVREQGIEPWVYQLARIGEKLRRCSGLQRAIVSDQKHMIRETLMDIAGHAIVAMACLENDE